MKTNKEKHPLYGSWAWMRRMNFKYEMDATWREDFWSFVNDMVERPSKQYQICRKDLSKGYSKDNCFWKEQIINDDKAAVMREYRKQNPDKFHKYELKKSHNLTVEEYDQLLKKQNHVCAICFKPEHVIHLGKPRRMAVDHCHETGKIRGLLCTNCNKLLGHAKDNKQILGQAIAYLNQTS